MRLLGIRLRPPTTGRKITILIGVIATISMVITFHVFKNVPLQQDLKQYLQESSEGRLTKHVNHEEGAANTRKEGIPIQDGGAGDRRNSTHEQKTDIWQVVQNKLKQIEATIEEISTTRQKVASLVSSSPSPGLMTVLENHGYQVYNNYQDNDWTLLLCTDKNNEQCITAVEGQVLQRTQRVNIIPALNDVLASKKSLCETYQYVKNIPSFKRSNLVLPCFILPEQFDEFVMTSSALGGSTRWVLHTSPSNTGSSLILIQPSSTADLNRLKQYRSQHAIVRQYLPNPAFLFGMSFNIQVLVLVTSTSPLRAYIHQQGAVQYRYDHQQHFQKVVNRVWSLERFRQYLVHHHGRETRDKALRNLDSVIVQTLLAAELKLQHLNIQRCSSCFQLFGFEAMFNSSFHPIIIDIIRNPLSNWSDVINMSSVFDDVINIVECKPLLQSGDSFVNHVQAAAEDSGYKVLCGVDSRMKCLDEDNDLWYLWNQRCEIQNMGHFRRLYPASAMSRYSPVLDDIMHLSKLQHARYEHGIGTMTIHSLLVALERHSKTDQSNEDYEEEDLPGPNEESHPVNLPLIEQVNIEDQHSDYEYSRPKCSESPETIPYLTGIYTKPRLNLVPQYYPATLEYHVTVPYDLLLVTVWAYAKSCSCEARLEERYGLSRPTNYTLGIGLNKITIIVVEVTHSDPWVINLYTVYITRSSHHGNPLSFTSSSSHQVCHFEQDCSLRYIPSLSCGLHSDSLTSWTDYLQRSTSLPYCPTGDVPGHWILPCRSCDQPSSCYWEQTRWQPHRCQHRRYGVQDLQSCMANKKILFLGDSTNRGIMHYVIERVNGSLTDWDKTHNIKHYPSLNHNQTSVSFAYYPQFWLAASQRPVIGTTLHQLINRSLPLQNDYSTVLILGGVQWLSIHHLTAVLSSLRSHGLSNIKLIMKSLGAGFHQPVDGLRTLTLKEQQTLVRRNRDLGNIARSQGFKVIDTFNMTMSRYKDFLQGKCACHFHRVTQSEASTPEPHTIYGSLAQSGILTKPDILRLRSVGSDVKQDKQTDNVQYHVEGEINAVYSEMVVNEICRQSL